MRVVCTHCKSINNIPKKESYAKANCGKCKQSLLEKNLIELKDNDFDEVIVNSDIPVIVDFWAPWCGPCKMFAPTFEKTSKEFALKVLFAKVNSEVEQNLGAKYNIRSIPTLVIFKNSKEIHRISGALDEANLRKLALSI